MKLPIIDKPVYLIKLPSFKDPVRITAYTMKESKILMLAKESENQEEILNAIKQVIQNCVVDDINVDEIPMYDLEVLYLNIQAKSVGENTDLYFECKNQVDGNNCGMVIECSVNLEEVAAVDPFPDTRIMFNETVGVTLKHPSISSIKKLLKAPLYNPNTPEPIMMAVYSLNQIFDKDSVYDAKDAQVSELIEFIESLSEPNFEKIEKFIENTPSVSKVIETDCPRCKYHHKILLEGLQDFFV